MKVAFPCVTGWLLMVLGSGTACNDDCDERCQSEHDHCVSIAHGDDSRVARCDADHDQCIGICMSEPVDFDKNR